MTDISNLLPGDKIKIVDKWYSGCWPNPDGKMDCYLGSILTVNSVQANSNGDLYANVREDGGKWKWFGPAIQEVVGDADSERIASEKDLCELLGFRR